MFKDKIEKLVESILLNEFGDLPGGVSFSGGRFSLRNGSSPWSSPEGVMFGDEEDEEDSGVWQLRLRDLQIIRPEDKEFEIDTDISGDDEKEKF